MDFLTPVRAFVSTDTVVASDPVPAVAGAVSDIVPVALHIAGCPPTPLQLLEGLLALLEASEGKKW